MDRFKEYIKEHKDQFRDDFQEKKVWNNIYNQLSQNKKAIWFKRRVYQVAASVALLVSVGVCLFVQNTHEVKKDNVAIQSEPIKEKPSHALIAIDTSKMRTAIVDHPVTKPSDLKISNRSKNKSNDNKINSYEEKLAIQLKKIGTTPVYAESTDYFDLFVNQYKELAAYERVLKEEFGAKEWEYSDVLLALYQQKYSLLTQLQFEIDKMNTQIISTPETVNETPFFIRI